MSNLWYTCEHCSADIQSGTSHNCLEEENTRLRADLAAEKRENKRLEGQPERAVKHIKAVNTSLREKLKAEKKAHQKLKDAVEWMGEVGCRGALRFGRDIHDNSYIYQYPHAIHGISVCGHGDTHTAALVAAFEESTKPTQADPS